MKDILNWKDKSVVNIYDEVNLWSAPFGRLLLENIPMKSGATILDIGFGTGFPLIELSQRFGEKSTIYGIDIWSQAIHRTREKIKVLALENITIIEASASNISLDDNQIDLITSNLGVNNFAEKEKVYTEIYRVLKPKGILCITTNPKGTFEEFFKLFETTLSELNLKDSLTQLNQYVDHRDTKESIISSFKKNNLNIKSSKSDKTNMRFADAESFFNHSLIRIGFREFWENMIPVLKREACFKKLLQKITNIIEQEGCFEISIPMLYLEFEKV